MRPLGGRFVSRSCRRFPASTVCTFRRRCSFRSPRSPACAADRRRFRAAQESVIGDELHRHGLDERSRGGSIAGSVRAPAAGVCSPLAASVTRIRVLPRGDTAVAGATASSVSLESRPVAARSRTRPPAPRAVLRRSDCRRRPATGVIRLASARLHHASGRPRLPLIWRQRL